MEVAAKPAGVVFDLGRGDPPRWFGCERYDWDHGGDPADGVSTSHRPSVLGPLTVKLRGRTQAPNWSRGRTISSRARGDTTDSHGPLQRLLEPIHLLSVTTYPASRVSHGGLGS